MIKAGGRSDIGCRNNLRRKDHFMAARTEKGHCGICPANCGVEIELENDRITDIHPWRGHLEGVPCVRGRYSAEIVYSPDRIRTPLKRKGPKGTLEFEPVSWDQALDEIAKTVFSLKSRYGPECLATFMGRGNFEQSLWQMFTAKQQGFSIGNSLFVPLGSPNAFSVGSICYLSYGVLAPLATFGLPMVMLQPDLENADVVFIWGTNPATDSPLNRMVRLQAAKRRGAKIIAVDPLRTASVRLADQWIPIQPGTDGALIHGLLHLCFKNDTIDRQFGEQWCEGFAELEEYVERFTPEQVERITRIPQATVYELSQLFGDTARISTLMYTGLEYSDTGVQAIRAFFTLLALTGHIDIEGGQRFQFPPPVSLRKPDVAVSNEVPAIGMDAHPYHCKPLQIGQFMEFPRSVLDGDPYKLRLLLIGGASILTNLPNAERFRQALQGLDYLICVDRFLTADCLYADIVLPAATYYESASFCGYPCLSPPIALQYRRRIIEPVGESLSDYLIYAKLAERLGHGSLYPQTEDAMVQYVIQDLPFSFEEFKERSHQGPLSLDPAVTPPTYSLNAEERKWLTGNLRPDGRPGFPTPSGKWEIASSVLKSFGYSPLPVYKGVKEGLENTELVKDYPLTLTTGTRIQSTFRSQHLNIPSLLKLQPHAEVLLHPQDAAPRGIATGDRVRLKTPRGTVIFTARVTDDILPGVVEANVGGGSPIQAEGWRDSNINTVLDDLHRDVISGFPVFKALLCEVEKE